MQITQATEAAADGSFPSCDVRPASVDDAKPLPDLRVYLLAHSGEWEYGSYITDINEEL